MPLYKTTIPAANDRISSTWRDMRNNFESLGDIFQVDHVALDDVEVDKRGKHNKATFIVQAADPTTAVGERALYSKLSGNDVELYMREDDSAGAGGTVKKVTSGQYLDVNCRLEAWAVVVITRAPGTLNFTFKVSEVEYQDTDGQMKTQTLSSPNVESVEQIASDVGEWFACRVTFNPVLSTDNYMWSLHPFQKQGARFQNLQVRGNATYSSSVTTSKLDIGSVTQSIGFEDGDDIYRFVMKIWTVAP